ncbi:hypothetical protein [Sphingomonas sp. IC081]|uniref:hypothetical protein n=1 Tax=Sphingomonas sp. IC081 TaxID=304378 RepID=UPI00163BEEBA|nr:hypothetical protein [Sphingomonas sp. IC081]
MLFDERERKLFGLPDSDDLHIDRLLVLVHEQDRERVTRPGPPHPDQRSPGRPSAASL